MWYDMQAMKLQQENSILMPLPQTAKPVRRPFWETLLSVNWLSDEQAMWRAAHRDDHKAFELIVRRWQNPMVRLCTRMVGDGHRAEDLAQEVFLRLYLKRENYQPSARFSTFLWRIAINLCIDDNRRRRRRRRPEVFCEDMPIAPDGQAGTQAITEESPDLIAVNAEQTGQVRLALQRLPEEYRAVIVLRHYEGLRFREIAEVLNIPEGTVKSRTAEAMARLARILGI
jgi:RNA polymerase sigma-70 factor, ECF subfamily